MLSVRIAAASKCDSIVFAQALKRQTITLISGEAAVTKKLDIELPAVNELTISGNHAVLVFDISGGVTLVLAGLTIGKGLADQCDAGRRGSVTRNRNWRRGLNPRHPMKST